MAADVISVEPLHALADALGIDIGRLVDAEGASRLAGTFRVPGTAVACLTEDLIDELVSTYMTALQLTVQLGALEEFSIGGDASATDLAKLVAAAPTTPSYDVVIQLDKDALLRDLIDVQGAQAVLYLHRDAFLIALKNGLRSIEQELWHDTTHRLIVLILDIDIELSGDRLAIYGGAQMPHTTAEISEPPGPAAGFVRASRRRDEYIGWDSELSTSLTPWHFAHEDASGDPTLIGQLDAVFVLLAVLFTCDRARVVANPDGKSRIQAEFRGREYVAFVPIKQSDALPAISRSQRSAVRSLVDWCYQSYGSGSEELDWIAERLPFLQSRVAQALEGRSEQERFHVYAANMPEIFEGARWHWRAFLEGRVSDYLDRVEKLESTIGDAVDRYAERTSALVKSLSDAILAAVAVVIGSFIAATFNEPFDATLFRIGVLTYAAYVLLFPGLLGLIAERGHANQIDATFKAHCARFEEALYPDKVREIIGPRIDSARTRFDRWWRGTAICFVAVAVLAVIAAAILPSHVM